MTDMFVAAWRPAAELSVAGLSVAITGRRCRRRADDRARSCPSGRQGHPGRHSAAADRPVAGGHQPRATRPRGSSPTSRRRGVQQVIDRAAGVRAPGRHDQRGRIIHVIPFLEIKPAEFEALMAVNAGTSTVPSSRPGR